MSASEAAVPEAFLSLGQTCDRLRLYNIRREVTRTVGSFNAELGTIYCQFDIVKILDWIGDPHADSCSRSVN